MLQGGEILIIALLALVVLGPKRLPEYFRKAGEWAAELRKAAREITQGLEAEVADLKAVGEDLKAPVDELRGSLKEIGATATEASRYEWTGPKPVSGPTPEDAMADLERIEAASAGEAAGPAEEDDGDEGDDEGGGGEAR